MVEINFQKMKEQVLKEIEGKEVWVGILTIFLDRKEVCVGWGKDLEELKTGEDRCFSIAEPDDETEWELEELLRDAVIQNVKLDDDAIRIYMIATF